MKDWFGAWIDRTVNSRQAFVIVVALATFLLIVDGYFIANNRQVARNAKAAAVKADTARLSNCARRIAVGTQIGRTYMYLRDGQLPGQPLERGGPVLGFQREVVIRGLRSNEREFRALKLNDC